MLVREQTKEIAHRAEQRLSYQINLLSLQAGPLIVSGQLDALQSIVSTMRQSSTIRGAQVTDTAGRTIVSSDTTSNGLFVLDSDGTETSDSRHGQDSDIQHRQ